MLQGNSPSFVKGPLFECLLAGLTLGLAGCATIYNPATERNETILSTGMEIALGNMAKTQMGLGGLTKGRVHPEELARVQRVGKKIASVSDRQDLGYQFGVVKNDTPNAFTLPGGTIYIHTGILDKATDAELASVIAHEVGHVAARHVVKHLQADLGFTVAMGIAQAAGAGQGPARVANSLYGLFSNGFSRQDELEADQLAIRYTDRAGYDPWAIVSFFEKMLSEEKETGLDRAAVWRSTHPLTSERIAEAKKTLSGMEGRLFCPECGRTYPGKAKFCEKDGAVLKELSRKGEKRP